MKFPLRVKYFFSHLLISLVIAGASLFLIFKIWYPTPLHIALGVGGLAIMLLAIDVILGPLLTLVLAKEGKKGLKTDLIIIGIIQLSALFYGLYSIDKGRPVAIAFDVNRFEPVLKHSIQGDNNKNIIQEYAQAQQRAIPVVAIRPAKDEQELAERMQKELELNILSSSDPTLYQDMAQSIDIIQTEMKPIVDLVKFNNKELVDPVLVQYPQADGFLPIVGATKTLTVLVDTKNKSFVAVVDLRPW